MVTPSAPRYDRLGEFYARHRRPDPRIARQIEAALGDARHIVDVGAGSGSYEPPDRQVVALEPSTVMMAQRHRGADRAVRGVAELLPFASGAFDAAMVVLSLHHGSDKRRGLTELCRVARRRVVLCFDVTLEHDFWLEREHLPEIRALDYGGYLSLRL